MKKKLSTKEVILVASTLFGMFFGAGNLIFPVHLGQLAGRNAWPAVLGFCITAVTIPILGVAAIGSTRSGGLQDLAGHVGRKYSYFFTAALYLTIGPLFAIPRCCTTSFTTGIAPLLSEGSSETLPLLLFSLGFFALVMFFSLKPSGITTWIGKIINPIFLLFLGVLLLVALLHPAAAIAEVEPDAAYASAAFFPALIEGYGTMDAIAGLAFGIVVINIVRGLGLSDDSDVARGVLKSGIFTGLLMALIYLLTIIMGAQSRGAFAVSANGGIALAQISEKYLGKAGLLVLAVTISFACLKTSIGLVTSCSEAFRQMFPSGPSYRTWAILFTLFSFGISNVGLTAIITCSLPVLMFLYPLAITLILLAIFGKAFGHDRIVYVTVTAFAGFAALFDLLNTLPAGLRPEGLIAAAGRFLPFFSLGLGWLIPSLIGLVLGLVLRKCRAQLH